MKRLVVAFAVLGLAASTGLLAGAPPTSADSNAIDFETYSLGTVNGQDGWVYTGAYDVEIVDESVQYPSFGDRSLRISNAITSGSFGDWVFSKPLVNEAGEADATGGGQSGGIRQRHFEAQLSIASRMPGSQQPGLQISVSPDRGDGSRMSFLRITDQTGGLQVEFADVQGTSNPANFVITTIASTLDRTTPHTLKLTMDLVDGPSNDLVKVYVDGSLVHTGTSWENYYRYDSEAAAEQSPRTTDSLIFQARSGGGAAPTTLGHGFLIDNITLASSNLLGACAVSDDGSTLTLLADCTTDHTLVVPNGYALDGDGHTITAVDPAGGHFLGAVVKNGGAVAHVKNLTVTASGLANVCDAGDNRLRGIMFDGASGSITNNAVVGINQGASGCQEGNAIEVRNAPYDGTHPATKNITVIGNYINRYQKTGVVANGDVLVIIKDNFVGSADLSYSIAANGVQFGYGGSGSLENSTIFGNQWCGPSDYAATAVLIYDADGVVVRHNNIRGNSDVGIYAFGDNLLVENNRVFDEGADCNNNGYDVGVGDYGTANTLDNNKVRGFVVSYDGLADVGTNKVIPNH